MAYTKNTWVDQDVQRPKTYEVTNNQDGSITLTDSFGIVTEIGTPVNATNMNHIEDGIKANDTAITTINSKIPSNASSSNKMVTASDIITKAEKTTLHALKGYLDAGELLTDSEGLADVTSYAHSTFDSTKFTVVGTPTITDDGIASGFSTSNYIVDNVTFDIINAQTLDLVIYIKSGNDISTTQYPLHSVTYAQLSLQIDNGKLNVNIGKNNTWGGINTLISSLTANTGYYLKFHFTTTGTELSYSTDNNNFTTVTTTSTMLGDSYNMQLRLGVTRSATNPFLGNIDLKQFSITVDGVPVFSGNKTGIDTIKPDDYTVVGSPTISDDGVASGFSSSNYVTASINETYDIVNNTYNFRIKYKYDTNGNGVIARIGRFWIVLDNTNIRLQGQDTNSAAKNFTNVTIPTPSVGDEYIITGSFGDSGNIRSLSVSVNGGAPINGTNTANTPNLSTQTSVNIWIGINNNATPLVAGSIDLNAYQIYVNGSLVYQPCLKIPYTKSKTGSKVVDSYYRPRVTDMYEQFGVAPYYTLLEGTNFTLPQGEIYGLMLNQSTPHIVESYENGKSGYIVYSNGLCKQWGYLATTSSSILEYTVTFLKNFRDANYSFSRSPYWTAAAALYLDNFSSFHDNGYTDKTTTTVSFWMHENTYQNGTDWVAIGYIN